MQADWLRDRFRGTILGTAVGDALGAPFEGQPTVAPQALQAWETATGTLRWTDDTQLTLALGESLLEQRGFDGSAMAAHFADVYEAEPWRGYGSGPPQVFHQLRQGSRWDEPARSLFNGQGSFGNGAAMRVAPIALFCLPAPAKTADLARQTARITHAHELGLQGAALQATAINRLIGTEPHDPMAPTHALLDTVRPAAPAAEFQQQLDRIASLPPLATTEDAAAALGNGIAATEAVPAALAAFLRTPGSFTDAVRFAVLLGGDTDTIAAMTGALSGAHLGASAIPPAWRQRLEQGERLTRLADALLDLVQAQTPGQL